MSPLSNSRQKCYEICIILHSPAYLLNQQFRIEREVLQPASDGNDVIQGIEVRLWGSSVVVGVLMV